MAEKVIEMERAKKYVESEEVSLKAREMKRKTLISKIKIDKEYHSMIIEYSGSNVKYSKETKFTGLEEMLPSKFDVVQELREKVCEMLDFPTDWVEDLIITGISFNYDPESDNDLRGMVVTMQKEIEALNCPLNINTPFIRFGEYAENNSAFPVEERCWDGETSNLIRDIINNAYLYMCGETKNVQQKLFA